jgi:CheY-like chemotaxis protein
MAECPAVSLQGRRLLIVEDEYLIAADLAGTLVNGGAEVIGPVGSVADALALISADAPDGAILDINLGEERAYSIADELRERGVPFVFATGYEAWVIPEAYRDIPRCEKPIDTRVLARLLTRRA